MKAVLFPCYITNSIVVNVAQLLHWRVQQLGICSKAENNRCKPERSIENFIENFMLKLGVNVQKSLRTTGEKCL